MTRDEARRLLSRASSPERAQQLIRSRARREQRAAARKAGLSVKMLQRQRFAEAVEDAFANEQKRIVPGALRFKEDF